MRNLILIVFSVLFSFPAIQVFAFPFPNKDNSNSGKAFNSSGLNPDASAVWVDPAALNNIDSVFNIALSVNAVLRNTKFQASEPSLYQAITDNAVLYPIQIHFAGKINPSLSLGLSIQPANSMQINWQEENWTGRFLIRDYNLKALIIQPAFSLKLSEMLAVGGGLLISSYQLEFNRSLPLRDINREALQNLKGNSIQMGINLGISAILMQDFYVSINYKSGQAIKFKNSDVSNTLPNSLTNHVADITTADIIWTTPENINLLVSYQLNKQWETNASLGWFTYGADNNIKVNFPTNTEFLRDFSIIGSSKNEIIYQLGASYSASDYFTFSAGSWYSTGNLDENFLFPAMVNGRRVGIVGSTTFMALPGLALNINFASTYFFEETGNYSPGNFGGSYKTLVFNPGLGIYFSF